jgi:hypothetical protein
MLYVVLTMPTLNKAYLFIIYLIWACYQQKGVFLLFAYFNQHIFIGELQQTQFDIFHTKVLQITSRCHVMALIWIIVCENVPEESCTLMEEEELIIL